MDFVYTRQPGVPGSLRQVSEEELLEIDDGYVILTAGEMRELLTELHRLRKRSQINPFPCTTYRREK